MTRKVVWSERSVFVTVVVMCIFVAAILCSIGNTALVMVYVAIIGLLIILACCYSPVSLTVTDRDITIKKIIGTKTIPLRDIAEITHCNCAPWSNIQWWPGSWGFFGFWGWYHEDEIGRYFGYFGNSSDCFLIRLNNGRQYVIGCEGSKSVVDYAVNMMSR